MSIRRSVEHEFALAQFRFELIAISVNRFFSDLSGSFDSWGEIRR